MSDYFGLGRFKDENAAFSRYLDELEAAKPEMRELISNFPVYVGWVNVGTYLFFYEMYKQVLDLAGNIADVGTWKGASFLFFVKLVKLFEPHARTQVHTFDWFEGMRPGTGDSTLYTGQYVGDYDQLVRMVELQGLQDIGLVNKMDICTELEPFLARHEHLRFKLVLIDCGIAEVLETSLRLFWPRLSHGGILIMDHYNLEASPKESAIIEAHIGANVLRHLPFNRQPTAYVRKEM